jgi:aspartate/methionine/tyrosine aminotransferase
MFESYQVSKVAKAVRAARLHEEAINCLTIAVGEQTEDFAAQLIDEAARLIRRSKELSHAKSGVR